MTLLKPSQPGPPAAVPIAAVAAATPQTGSQLGRFILGGLAFAAPHGVGLAIFTLPPIIVSLVISLFDWPVFGDAVPRLRQLLHAFSDPVFRRVVLNTGCSWCCTSR